MNKNSKNESYLTNRKLKSISPLFTWERVKKKEIKSVSGVRIHNSEDISTFYFFELSHGFFTIKNKVPAMNETDKQELREKKKEEFESKKHNSNISEELCKQPPNKLSGFNTI